MASGPWDNVSLPSPPNNPAYLQAWSQLANTGSNLVNNAFNAYQQGQNFQYQQAQRNFFQDPNNQQLLQQALQTKQYAPLMQALIQQGGTPAAQQLLPQLIQQGASQNADELAWGKPPNPTAPAAGSPSQIVPRRQDDPGNYYRNGPNDGEGVTINYLAAQSHTNLERFLAANPQYRSWQDKDLNDNEARAMQTRMRQFREGDGSGAGTANSLPQSGTGDQQSQPTRAAASNQLTPSMGEGSSAMTPRQTSERRIAQAPAQPPPPAQTSFDKRFQGIPNESEIQRLFDQGDRKLRAAGTWGITKEKAEALRDAGNKDIEKAKQLQQERMEIMRPTEMEKNEAGGAAAAAKQRELRQVRYDKMDAGIQEQDRAASLMDDHTRAMFGILEQPQLFTGAGHVTVGTMRQIVQNFMPGADPNTTLPNEALRKVTAQNLQNQLSVLKADAQEAGESAGRVMLAQIKIMQDAAQNPEVSIPTLRYLTEMGARASDQQHKIAQLARDYKRAHGGELGPGFDQELADFFKNPKNRLLTPMEERNIKYLSAPRLPTNIVHDEEQRAWARQHGVNPGDPVRTNKTYPAQYVPSL